jgi:hypothetical protein
VGRLGERGHVAERSTLRWKIVGLLAALAVPLAAPPPSGAAGTCADPEAVYRYGESDFVYEITIDLSGCSWWHGDSLFVDGSLSRSGLDSISEVNAPSICRGDHPATCSLRLSLAHPRTDVAQYNGRVSYPGPHGRKSQTLEVTCFTLGGRQECRNGRAPLLGTVPPLDQLPLPRLG